MVYGKYWVSSLMLLLITCRYLSDAEAKKFSIHLEMYRTNACFGISLNCLPMQRRGNALFLHDLT
ncbi:hypothetical protein T01_494 [Trichinella spiralis]|uniref:Secreted protein n=1 Tax=Trichinella spiralis TaxID=6334 RepID=A0A0V1AMQ9_TRISP|nr:hypothetical protein T01_494 [Trichinella spiralis]